MKKLFAFTITGGLVTAALALPAQADIFTGTHEKLGKVNLSINSWSEAGRPSPVSTHIYFSIEKGHIYAYGTGSANIDLYGRNGSVSADDADNLGYSCRSLVSFVWSRNLNVTFKYPDDQFNRRCPVRGESYTLQMTRAADNARMYAPQSGSVNEPTYLSPTKYAETNTVRIEPGEIVYQTGEAQRNMVPFQRGWGFSEQFIPNQRFEGRI